MVTIKSSCTVSVIIIHASRIRVARNSSTWYQVKMAGLLWQISRSTVHLKKRLFHYAKGYPRGHGKLVLVPGVQRSGTNMVMDVLERSMLTEVYHERDQRAFQHCQLRASPEIRRLYDRSRAPFFVLKGLLDSHRVAEIREDFDESMVIWPYRDFRDMVNSHLVSWPGFRERIDEIVKGDVADNWRARGLSNNTLMEMRSVYREDLNEASCIALFWYMRNALFFDQQLHRDPGALLVRYESIVTEPDVAFQNICSHIGLPYQKNIHSIVHARSVAKRPAPPIDQKVEALCNSMLDRLVSADAIKDRG